jgi:hypothetical protein
LEGGYLLIVPSCSLRYLAQLRLEGRHLLLVPSYLLQ